MKDISLEIFLLNLLILVLVIIIMVGFSLHSLTLVIAGPVMLFNIWHLGLYFYQTLTSSSQQVYRIKQKNKPEHIKNFQKTLKEIARQKINQYEEKENNNWRFSRETIEKIDLQNSTIELGWSKKQDFALDYKSHFNIAEKLRKCLRNVPEKESDYNVDKLGGILLTKKVDKSKITEILIRINEYLESNIEQVFEEIQDALNSVDQFLVRAFGVSLTFGQSDKRHITYRQLMQLITLIETSNLVPKQYPCSFNLVELKCELKAIKEQLNLIPNLHLSPTILKMQLGIRCLRVEFPHEKIYCVSSSKPFQSQEDTFQFVLLDNGTFYYSKNPQFKTNFCESLILLFILDVYKKYSRSGKNIFRELNISQIFNKPNSIRK